MGPRVEEFAGKENSAHLTTAKQQKERQNEVIFKHFCISPVDQLENSRNKIFPDHLFIIVTMATHTPDPPPS